MEILLALVGLILICMIVQNSKTMKAVKANPPRAAIEPKKRKVPEEHKMKSTLFDRRITKAKDTSGQDFLGWHFWCKCGTIAPSDDNDGSHGSGTEESAVRTWHKHAMLYANLVDSAVEELEQVQKEFEEYKDKCFCKVLDEG